MIARMNQKTGAVEQWAGLTKIEKEAICGIMRPSLFVTGEARAEKATQGLF
jgi:hypothetical protein